MITTQCHIFETAAGFCGIGWNGNGVSSFQLPTQTEAAANRLMARRAPEAVFSEPTPEIAHIIEAVRSYFGGGEVDFAEVRLDLEDQDALFREIYAAVRQLGWGSTTTYGALAKTLGKEPQVARDVGQAMAKNPVPLIIPCHRVLAAGGKVGGFSAPGGAASKVRMLELEGVRLDPPEPAQRSLAL